MGRPRARRPTPGAHLAPGEATDSFNDDKLWRAFARSVRDNTVAEFVVQAVRVGGFGGVGDQMNGYYTGTGNPAYFNVDLARYRALGPTDVTAAAAKFLPLDKRVELVVEPAKEAGK